MPSSPTILHLISPHGNWEPFARVTAMAAALRSHGLHSAIAAPAHSRLWELAEASGVDVTDFLVQQSLNPLRWRDLARLIAQTNAVIVHVHDKESAVLLKRAGLFAKRWAAVASRYDLGDQPVPAEYGRGVTKVVCPSEAMAAAMRRRGAAAAKIRVVYDGASRALADRANDERDAIRVRLRQTYAPRKEKPLFLVNISPFDGAGGQAELLDIMPEVLAVLPQAHLILMGEGAELAELKRRVNILAIEDGVSFVEPDKSYHRLLSGADLYVAPGEDDVSGFMVQAAMMAGRGIAARAGGCHAELLEDGVSGVLAQGGGTESLQEAVMAVLTDKAGRERIGKQARVRAEERFDIATLSAQMAAVYGEML